MKNHDLNNLALFMLADLLCDELEEEESQHLKITSAIDEINAEIESP